MYGGAESSWHPVARGADLVAGHVFHGRLLGRELALWRDANGQPNAWENRCPHRGVRLTLGLHLGNELRCLYHGLHYASRTGRCTAIPSLANRELPRTLTLGARTYPVLERHGFVWVSFAEGEGFVPIEPLDNAPVTTLRSVVILAPSDRVAAGLQHYRFVPSGFASANMDHVANTARFVRPLTLACTASAQSVEETVVLIVQPADDNKAIVHGTLIGELSANARRAALRHHNRQLCALRDELEARASGYAAGLAAAAAHAPALREERT